MLTMIVSILFGKTLRTLLPLTMQPGGGDDDADDDDDDAAYDDGNND